MSDLRELGPENVNEVPHEYAASAAGVSACPFCGSENWRCVVKGSAWEFTCGSCGNSWEQNPLERISSFVSPGKKSTGVVRWGDIVDFFIPRNLTSSEITLIL